MTGKYIPYGRQCIEEDDIQAVVEVLKSDFLTTGPKIAEFEKDFANYIGAKYAVAVSNGTAALHAACFAAGITKGDEVITSAVTFAASSNCVLYCGGKPVFCDINPRTYNIDINDIERKITHKTKAIIPVHFTGQPCEMELIHKIANKNNLIVIEDAAHALGAKYKGKMVGNLSDMTTFSFHPVKHITTGEGGMITTNDETLYKKLVLFRSHGITRDKKLLFDNDGDWYYEQQILGYNYRMSDIQGALGITQLKKQEKFLNRRKQIVDKYNKAFCSMDSLMLQTQLLECESSWHLYIIRLDKSNTKRERKEIFNALRSCNIGVNVHYLPVYKHPYYQRIGYNNVCCIESELLYESMITLPLFYSMTDEEVDFVIDKVKALIV